jgi:hypothetical protein
MNNPYNIAVVLLRFSGIIFIFFCMLGLIYIGLFLFILLQGARDWFSQSVAPSALQSILTSPLYIIGGGFMIRYSSRLARFIAKTCESKESQS